MPAVRPLIFQVSSDIVNRYKDEPINYNLFNSTALGIDESDNLLIVPIYADDYKPVSFQEVERVQGYVTGFAKLKYIPYQFDAEIQDQRIAIYQALKDLINESVNEGNYTLITLYDYLVSTPTNPYTLRYGTIQLTPKSGEIKTNSGRYHLGFTLTFQEVLT